MTKSNLNKQTSELEVIVTADAKLWKTEQEKAFAHLAKELTLKGFRKGQVPLDLAKKNISPASIFSHAVGHMVPELAKEAANSIDKDTMILDGPIYTIEKVSDTEVQVKFIYPVYPEVDLGDYKKLGIKYKEEKVTDQIVEDEINRIADSQSTLKVKNGNIAKGDIVIFDFEGFVAGKAFEGGKAEKFELQIGSGQFIPGFEDKMIGLKAPSASEIKVTFPKEYHSTDLQGKEATFKIKIHEVKEKIKPTLDDAWAVSIQAPDVKTMDQLKKYIKTVFAEQFRQQAHNQFHRSAFDKILETAKFVVPSGLVAAEMKQVAANFEVQLKRQNLSIDQYMKFTGSTKVQLDAQFRSQAEARLRDALIFAEIAKREKIKLEDADYEAEYKKLAKVYGQSEDAIRGVITKEQMQIPMTNDRVIEALIKYNAAAPK